MLVILLIAIITIFTGVTLVRRNRGNHAMGAKIVLVISYLALIAQSIEAEHAAVQADTQQLAGGTNGWFGQYWTLAWMLNLLAVISLHIYLFKIRQPKSTPNHLVS
jgi:hypothetical protein